MLGKCANKSSVLYKELLKIANDDTTASAMYEIITDLQEAGLISKKRFSFEPGKMHYFIPMIQGTEETIAKSMVADRIRGSKPLDKARALDEYLTVKDIDWIDFRETRNSFYIEINKPDLNKLVQADRIYDLSEELEDVLPKEEIQKAVEVNKQKPEAKPSKPAGRQLDLFDEYSFQLTDEIAELEVIMDPVEQEVNKSDEFVMSVVDMLKDNLQLPEGSINFVTAEEAYEITKNAPNPYRGEAGFNYKGKVYFVKGMFSFNTAVHEMSHPFIKALKYQNPELFETLFNNLTSTAYGQQVLNESLAEFKESLDRDMTEEGIPDSVKEEVLVKFLTESVTSKLESDPELINKNINKTGLAKILQDLLFALKKMFRQIFGKGTKIEKLKADTTLKELADLLTTETFNIDMSIISRDEMVDYIADQRKMQQEINDALLGKFKEGEHDAARLIYEASNEGAQLYKNLLEDLRKNKDIEALSIVLNENWQGETQVTQAFKDLISINPVNFNKVVEGELDALNEFTKVANNLTGMMVKEDLLLERMGNRLNTLEKSSIKNERELINELRVYRKHIKHLNDYVDNFLEIADEADISENDQLVKEMTSFQNKVNKRLSKINKIMGKVVQPVLENVWQKYMGGTIAEMKQRKAELEEKIKTAEGYNKQALTTRLERVNQKLDLIDLNQQSFKEYLLGQKGDITILETWFEEFIAQQDPSIATFAMFVKENISAAHIKEYKRFNELRERLKPLEKQLGISPEDINAYAQEFLTEDTVQYLDEEGNPVELSVYSILNPYKNQHNTMPMIYEELENLKEEYSKDPSTENRTKLEQAEKKLKMHKALFFTEEMQDDYYFTDSILLNNPDVNGAELLKQVQDIHNEINAIQLGRGTVNGLDEIHAMYEEIKVLRYKLKELYSDYENGVKKDEQGLKNAKALREYRDAKSKFYKSELNKGDFEQALEAFELLAKTSLEFEGKYKDEEFLNKFKELRTSWIAENTRQSLTAEFYEDKAYILNSINKVSQKIEDSLQLNKTISNVNNSQVLYNNKLYTVAYDGTKYTLTNKDEVLEFEVNGETLIADMGIKIPTQTAFSQMREYVFESLLGKKDENGEYIVSEMTEEHLQKIKEMQMEMEALKNDIVQANGLTAKEQAEISTFYSKFEKGIKLTSSEYNRYQILKNKKAAFEAPKALREELKNWFKLLSDLQSKQASTYYLEEVNNRFYDLLLENQVIDGNLGFTLTHVEALEDVSTADNLMELDEEFKDWFLANHFLSQRFDADLGAYVDFYARLEPWNKVVPNDPKYLEQFTITNSEGQEELVYGAPARHFYRTERKDEYKRGYDPETGTVNNEQFKDITGKYRPRTLDEMREIKEKYGEFFAETDFSWDHYINYDYYKVMDEGGPKAEILKVILDYHLETQKGLNATHMLGYMLPRYRADLYQNLTADDRLNFQDRMKELWEKAKSKVVIAKDDFENDFNYVESVHAGTRLGYRSEDQKLPITGKYLLDKGQVSRDIFTVLGTYALSAGENKKLQETSYVARYMQDLAAENIPYTKTRNKTTREKENKNLKQSFRDRLKSTVALRTGDANNRKKLIDGMVESFYEGKKFVGDQRYQKALKALSPFTGLAVHSFFAFDLHSAGKNYLGARSMVGLQALNSKYFSYKSFWEGSYWAGQAMAKLSYEIYKDGAKSLDVQIIDIFDGFQGRTKEKMATGTARTFKRDFINLNWFANTRQYLEIHTNVETLSAILHHVKIDQTVDGKTKKIKYKDAWELDPETKTIKLKEGIDPKYDINGSEFNNVKFASQEHNSFAQGAGYAEFDKNLLDRTAIGAGVTRMKKFFTKMLLDRFAYTGGFAGILNPQERINVATGQTYMGFYIKGSRTIIDIVKSLGRDIQYLEKDERMALIRMMVDMLKAQILYRIILLSWMLGFDLDDPDKYQKMKARSGALPFLTDDEYNQDFNTTGWLTNNLILLLLNTEQEVGFFTDWNEIMKTGSSWMPVTEKAGIESTLGILDDVKDLVTGKGLDVYSRDSGALNVKQSGEYKFWMKLYKMIGIKGKLIDPVTSTRNIVQFRKIGSSKKQQEEDEN